MSPESYLTTEAPVSPTTADAIVLQDICYLQNIVQKGVLARQLRMTLYADHLKLEDYSNSEVLEDVSIHDIQKTTPYISSWAVWLLRTALLPDWLMIKTKERQYHLRWVTGDQALKGNASGTLMSGRQYYEKTMQWVVAIRNARQ